MDQIEQELQKGFENPSIILEQQTEEDQKQALKNIHNIFLQSSQKLKQNQNEKLIIKNTDLDQIWEQIKLHIDIVYNSHKKTISKLYEQHQELQEEQQENSESQEQNSDLNQSQTDDDDEEDDDDENLDLDDEFEEELEEGDGNDEDEDNEEDEEQLDEEDKKILQANNDEDSFEKMEKFLEQADVEDQNFDERMKKFEKGDLDEDIDDEDDLGSNYELSQDNSDAQDFFNKAQMKRPGQETDDEDDEESGKQEDLEEELDDDEIENDVFDEQRENKLQNETETQENQEAYNEDEITKFESELMGDKDWQHKGEIRAKQRPVDSLVQETLDFKNNKKEKEEITEEYSKNLDEIIKQRILDEAFDDRQRVQFSQHIKENFAEISRDKSEKGLAELYEDEFKSSIGLNNQSKDDKLKQEIMDLFKQTCYKLDALSNLNFTPKPITKQAEIQASKLKINIDEKIPLHLSSKKAQINPNDLLNEKKDVTFKSKEEMTHQENRTERSKNKKVLRTRKKETDRKKMLKTLEYTGQTKHEYNLLQDAKKEGKKIEKNKKQASVKFNKSGDFFKNLQSTLDNKKAPIIENSSKKIKKAQKL